MVVFSIRVIIFICVFYNAYSDIADYVKDVCGGANTCSIRSNNSLPSDSCCRPCECADICLEKGTCCSDRDMIADIPGHAIRQACLPSIKYAKTARYRSARYRSSTQSFYVRATCPESYSDQQTRNKCEIDEPESLEDIPFVSSDNGKIVYKNRHCAACHGEVDVIAWKILIDWFCIKEAFLDNHNASFLAYKLMKSCSLPFIRPNITQWKYAVCHEEKRLISSCPDVNTQDRYPDNTTKELQEMCANDKSALTVYMENKVYANVYCYLCNKDSRPTCDLNIPYQKFLPNIFFLLNTTPVTDNQHEVLKEGACGHQEFYDILFETCRRIRCPLFEMLSQGTCVSLTKSSKFNYGFNFVLVPEANQMLPTDTDISHISEALSKLLTHKLGLESCLICSVSVWSKSHDILTRSVGNLYLLIVFTSSPHCERELLLSTAAKLEDEVNANKNLTIVTEAIPFHFEYIWSDELFRNLRRNCKTVYTFKRCAFFNPSKFMNCPKINLTVEEYHSVVNKSHLANLQAVRSNQYFEVCLGDYNTFSHAKQSNGKPTRVSGCFIFPCVIFILLFVSMLT